MSPKKLCGVLFNSKSLCHLTYRILLLEVLIICIVSVSILNIFTKSHMCAVKVRNKFVKKMKSFFKNARTHHCKFSDSKPVRAFFRKSFPNSFMPIYSILLPPIVSLTYIIYYINSPLVHYCPVELSNCSQSPSSQS